MMGRYEKIKHHIEMLAAEEFQRGRMAIIQSVRIKFGKDAQISGDIQRIMEFLDYMESL